MNSLLAAYAAQQKTPQNPAPQQPQHYQKPRSDLENSDEVEACFRGLQISESTRQDGEQYLHQSLVNQTDQIRLFLLAPSQNVLDRIDGTLQTVTLHQAGNINFKAISYACGDQNDRKDVFINGRKLSITSSLYGALQGLRHPTRFQRFWADAICIHQKDPQEKGQQILLMRDIYSLAAEVIVWLGESDRELDTLFRQLSIVDPGDMIQQTNVFLKMIQDGEASDEVLQGFIKLYKKPWFSRVWCTQESMVASTTPTVVCGQYRTPWTVINTALITIDFMWPNKKTAIQKQLQDAASYSMAGTAETNFKAQGKLTLNFALNATSAKDATDPRDKIYAILGLVAPEIRGSLAPNYSQPLTQLYQNAMMAMCREHSTLNCLWAAAGSARNPEINLPTWCLDFSNTQWQKPFIALHDFPLVFGAHTTGAGGKIDSVQKPYFEHDPQTSRLIIDGTIVGILDDPTPLKCATSMNIHTQVEKQLAKAGSEPNLTDKTTLSDLESQIVYQFLQDVKNAAHTVYRHGHLRYGPEQAASRIQNCEVWRTIMRNHSLTNNLFQDIWTKAGLAPPTDFSTFESFLQQFGDKMPVPTTWEVDMPLHVQNQISPSKLVEDCMIKTCLAMARTTPDRTFIVTDTGFLGNASNDVRAGDLLCVVFRCNQPLVLRTNGVDRFGRHMYNLVASAWVNGLMGGELADRADVVRQRFVLV